MPQVHNKLESFDAASAFGKNSQFMNSLRFTENSLHKVKILNKTENRLTRKKIDFYQRELNFSNWKHERVRNRLMNNLQKRIAYKFVLRNHSISNAKDYQKALDQNYTYTAFHHEVNKMVNFLRPERVRERKAKALVHENKNLFDNVVFNNTTKFNKLFPEKKTWLPRIHGKIPEPEPVVKEPEPTPLPSRERKAKKSLATLRRRIITLDDSKPNSPLKQLRNLLSPLKTPTPTVTLQPPTSASPLNPPKRLEISMSMMKKQKSFQETKEKSGILADDQGAVMAMESKMRKMSVDDSNENKENVNDANNNQITMGNAPEVNVIAPPEEIEKGVVSNKTVRSKRKNSLLPPIETNKRVPSDEKTDTKQKSTEPVKLPALKLSKKGP